MNDPHVVHIDKANHSLIAVMFGEDVLLNWAGLIMPMGKVDELEYEISPRPDGWLISFKLGDAKPWFVCEESIAMQIEALLERHQ